MRLTFEAAVSLAVARDEMAAVIADRRSRRAPEFARVLVLDIDDLARPIGHRIIRPRRELILFTVDRPGVTAPLNRDLKAERRIRDHIDPWSRCALASTQNGHIFASVGGKPAQSVEELKVAWHGSGDGTVSWRCTRRHARWPGGRRLHQAVELFSQSAARCY